MLKQKKLIPIIIGTFILLQGLCSTTAFAQPLSLKSTGSMTSRLAGSNRYATSLAISQNGWSHAANVIIATGEDFPDALSASALSKAKDAPIILTVKNTLSSDVIAELKRLGTTDAFIVGGTGVISTSIENQLRSLNIGVTRLGGANRYETSKLIADSIGANNGVVVATGLDFPDALSIAPIAGIKSMPILLAPKTGFDANISAFIKGKSIPVSYIVGGTGVLSTAFDSSAPNNKRLSGNDRFGTNLCINNYFVGSLNFDTVYLATGLDFPDALSGSALAAKNNAPIILTNQNTISSDILNFLKSKGVKHVVILGGTGVISQNVENTINTGVLVNASSVYLNKTSDSILLGSSDTLTASITPVDTTDKSVIWTSSNPSVASVDSNGKVTGMALGNATITVTTTDGGFKASCAVNILPIRVSSINLSKTSDSIIIDGGDTLTATVAPANAANKAIIWTSSNPAVATVDSNGSITTKSLGSTTITVASVDGGASAFCTLTVTDLDITSKFTDNNFKAVIYAKINKISPAPILYSDVRGIKDLDAHNKNICSLNGIEYFKSLDTLNCRSNALTNFDISKNTALTYLDCEYNQLSNLTVSNNSSLRSLYCSDNQLTSLDVTKNIALIDLYCEENQLTALDVTKNTALKNLYCGSNYLTALNINNNLALENLDYSYNQLTNLNTTFNLALKQLSGIQNKLTNLDVTKNTALTLLDCDSNQLTALDVTKNTALNYLGVMGCKLTSLNITKNTALTFVDCGYNKLTSLDLSGNASLQTFSCSNNQITSLDVTSNPSLIVFDCSHNNINTLDLSNNSRLLSFYCENNDLNTLNICNNLNLTDFDCTYNEITTLYSISDIWDSSYYNPQYIGPTHDATTNTLIITVNH